MHGRFPTHNKYYLAQELFPFLSKKEKKDVFFPTKDQRSKNVPKRDLKLSREDQEVLDKYRAK